MQVWNDPASRARARWSAGSKRGFSVVELLVSLFLISLLVTIFVPGALRKQILANEAAAIGALKSISTASAAFYGASAPPRYPSDLGELASAAQPYLDPALASGQKSGYSFSLSAADAAGLGPAWSAEAHPIGYRRAGVRSFFIDTSGRLLAQDVGGFPGNAAMQPWSPPE